MSDVIRKLEAVRSLAWTDLVPAINHAIALAREAEFIAAQSANVAMCSVDPAYMPIVELLANADRGEASR